MTSDSMSLLYVTKTSVLDEGGGGEKRAREVTAGLADRGHDITILCGKTGSQLDKWDNYEDCKVRHVTCAPAYFMRYPKIGFYLPRYLFAITIFPVLLYQLATSDYDLIVENMTPYPTLTVVLAKLFGIPIVAVQHEFYDRECFDFYDPLTGGILIVVQNLLRLFEYDMIVVPATSVKRDLVQYGVSSESIEVIPNGIDHERYWHPTIETDPARCVTIGRLDDRKGHHTVIEAFAEVRSTIPEARLDIIGDGPKRDQLRRISESLGISNEVTFQGYVSEDEKCRLLNRAEVFMFGSRQEGFGLVLLEAMAAGLPVVACELAVYEDFFKSGRNGVLVPMDDSSEMATAVVKILEDDQHRTQIRDTNQKDVTKFTWEKTTTRTEGLLRSVIAADHPDKK